MVINGLHKPPVTYAHYLSELQITLGIERRSRLFLFLWLWLHRWFRRRCLWLASSWWNRHLIQGVVDVTPLPKMFVSVYVDSTGCTWDLVIRRHSLLGYDR